MAAASDVVVMARGLGAGEGVGEVGDGSATLRSADEVQPQKTIRPERANWTAKTVRTAKNAGFRNVDMKGSPTGAGTGRDGCPISASAG